MGSWYFLIQCANALFESQQGLVDLGSVNLCLLTLLKRISSSLTPSQINEGKFSKQVLSVIDRNLQNGMGPRRLGVGPVLGCDSEIHSLPDAFRVALDAVQDNISRPNDVYIALRVLSYRQVVAAVQEVIYLSTVNFKKLALYFQVSECRVVLDGIENVMARVGVYSHYILAGIAVHCVRLPGPRLSICKDRDLSSTESLEKNRSHTGQIQLLIGSLL